MNDHFPLKSPKQYNKEAKAYKDYGDRQVKTIALANSRGIVYVQNIAGLMKVSSVK